MKRTGTMLSLVGAAAMALAGCGNSSTEDNASSADTKAGKRSISAGPGAGSQPQARGPRPSLPPVADDTGDVPEVDQPRRERLRKDRRDRFKQFDTDGDGTISAEERDAMREQREAMREQRKVKRSERMKGIFDSIDGDGDGKLSRDELEATDNRRMSRMLDRFGDIDTDGDGTISTEEMTEMMSRRGRRMRRGGRDRAPAPPDSQP